VAKPPRKRPAVRAAAGAESPRSQDLLEIERGFWERGIRLVAGIDEVGRGPLAGPVVAAAVIMPPELRIAEVDDSKRLTPAKRLRLVEQIRSAAYAIGVGAASATEVDRLNVRRATALAMQRAIARLGVEPGHRIVDGLPVPELGLDTHTAVVGGDRCVHCIACASIIAKVVRDRLMQRLAARHPGYGWERNMGYGTPAHLDALRRLGPTPHHRRSFHPIDALELPLRADGRIR
jgi:ribonuclease HII